MRIRSLVITAVLATAIFGFGVVMPVKAACSEGNQAVCDLNSQISALQAQLQQLGSGQTMPSLQLQIQILMLQIQLMQVQNGGGQPTTWCHAFNTNLGYSNSGTDEVGYLHTALGKEGISYSPDAGNQYAEGTMNAVVQFQANCTNSRGQSCMIPQTGYVGTQTRAALNDKYKCATTTQPSITITSPNGGEQWAVDSTHRITWNSTGVGNVRIYMYITDVSGMGSGGTNYVIPNNAIIPASQGYYDWTIVSSQLPFNSTLPHNYKIRVDSMDNGDNVTVSDSSDNFFTIATSGPLASASFLSATSNYTYNVTTPANSVASGVISFKLEAHGGTLSQLTSNNVAVQVCNYGGNCTSTGVIKSITVTPNQDVSDGGVATVTVNTSYTGGSGFIYFKISEINWTVGGATTSQTSGLDSYKTPVVNAGTGNFTPVATSIRVTPVTISLTVGGSSQPLTNNILDQNGNSMGTSGLTGMYSYAWQSSNYAVANVDQSGRVTPVGPGTANITFVGNTATSQIVSSPSLITVTTISTQPFIDSLSASSVTPGSSVTIYGRNLFSANPVVMYLTSNHSISVTTNAFVFNSNGTDATFNVPSNAAPGNYGLTIWVQGSQVSSNEVPITITSSSTQPSITITSPDGVQGWAKGSQYNIRWNSTGVSSVLIIWTKMDTPNQYLTGWITPANKDGRHIVGNAGSYLWTIPKDIADGRYIVQVFNYDPNTPGPANTYAVDPVANSATFSIFENKVSSIVSQSSLASISDALVRIMAGLQAMLSK